MPRIAICVPVRDEEALLPFLIDAVAGLDTAGLAAVLCLYLDGCHDRSAEIARAARLPFPVRIEEGARGVPSAGRARAAAMALGLAAVGADGLLLSTDADSCPQADWLQAGVQALAAADVVAGRLVRNGGEGDTAQARLELYYDRLHAHRRSIDPVPWDATAGCHHGGGANMGMRAAAYVALGGFRPLASGEDAALLDDAGRAGFRVRRDPAMVVRTSSRRIGRAPEGLATALAEIDREGVPRVAHPAAADWQYRAQALARATFALAADPAARAALGCEIGLTGDHVLGVARDCANAEAFAIRIVPAAPFGERLVPLAEAEQALALLELAPAAQPCEVAA